MNSDLARRLDDFGRLPVAVVGEAMLGSYLEGAVGRFCPEAPVPIVALAGREDVRRRERPGCGGFPAQPGRMIPVAGHGRG
jgi:bifunctional ADP-heptose synthase (sugar kinase/adenylyltransferase)